MDPKGQTTYHDMASHDWAPEEKYNLKYKPGVCGELGINACKFPREW